MAESLESLGGKIDQLARAVADGFARTEHRFDAHDARLDRIDARLDAHDRRFDAHDRRFDEHDRRFDEHDRRFDAHDARFSAHDAEFVSIREEFSTMREYIDFGLFKLREETEGFFNELRAALGADIARLERKLDSFIDRQLRQ